MLVDVGAGVGDGVLVGIGVLVGDGVGVGEGVEVDVGVEVGDDVEVGFGVLVGTGDGVAVDVGVNVGVGVLVDVTVGMAVAVGVTVGIAVAVGESVGVDDGVLVGAGVKVGIGALIGTGVLSVPKKQAEATGSVRNAMRITYGRGFIALPRLVQGVDGHDVEGMRRMILQTSAMRCMSCLHIESPWYRTRSGHPLAAGQWYHIRADANPVLPGVPFPVAAYCSSRNTSTGLGAHG